MYHKITYPFLQSFFNSSVAACTLSTIWHNNDIYGLRNSLRTICWAIYSCPQWQVSKDNIRRQFIALVMIWQVLLCARKRKNCQLPGVPPFQPRLWRAIYGLERTRTHHAAPSQQFVVKLPLLWESRIVVEKSFNWRKTILIVVFFVFTFICWIYIVKQFETHFIKSEWLFLEELVFYVVSHVKYYSKKMFLCGFWVRLV